MLRTLAIGCVSLALPYISNAREHHDHDEHEGHVEEGVTVEENVLWEADVELEEGVETRDVVTSETWRVRYETVYHLDGDEEDHNPHAHRIRIEERIQHVDVIADRSNVPEEPVVDPPTPVVDPPVDPPTPPTPPAPTP